MSNKKKPDEALPEAMCPKCEKKTVFALTSIPRGSRCRSCGFEYTDVVQAHIDLGLQALIPWAFAPA
jgi:uncharacterized protein (DUF983 family)